MKPALILVVLLAATFSEIISVPPAAEDSEPPKGPPCGKDSKSCGKAVSFSSQEELDKFLPPVIPSLDTSAQAKDVYQTDLMINDGQYIYRVSNQTLSIIRAYPPQKAEVVTTSPLYIKPVKVTGLLIQGIYLIVFGAVQYESSPFHMAILIYDVQNKTNPSNFSFFMRGEYFDARKLSDGSIYVVTTHRLAQRKPETPFDAGFETNFWYPQNQYIDPFAVTIFTFNLSNSLWIPSSEISVFVESKDVIIYMTEQYVYLASNYTDTDGETNTKIRKVYVWGDYIQPFAEGTVKGTVKDQSSLDQYGKFLRIATTRTMKDGKTSVGVYTLDYRLEPYGSIPDVAPSEVVVSCRFVNRRLYLSTSNKIYPFIIVEFPTYKNPQVLGRLKISGYTHAYNSTTMIGIEREVQSGQKLGRKVVLINVTDVANPKILSSGQIPAKYSNSIIDSERTFIFSSEKNMLVIPARNNQGEKKFNGVLVFHINMFAIEFATMIDHLGPKGNYNEATVDISFDIGIFLYTKSQCLLKISNIIQPYDPVGKLDLPCK